MIVVMTNGNANQAGAQNEVPPTTPQGGQGMAAYQRMAGKFEEHLAKDVVPFIEKNFRALTGKDNRAIAGLSWEVLIPRQSRITIRECSAT